MKIYTSPSPETWTVEGLAHVSAKRIYTYEAMRSAYLAAHKQAADVKGTISVCISETFFARAPRLLLEKIFIDLHSCDNPDCVKILLLNPFCKAAQQRCSTLVGRMDPVEPCSRIVTGLSHIAIALVHANNQKKRRDTDLYIQAPGQKDWEQPFEGAGGSYKELRNKIQQLLKKISEDNLVKSGRLLIKFYDNDFFPFSYIFGDILATPFSFVKTPNNTQSELDGNQFERPFIFWKPVLGDKIPLELGYERIYEDAKESFDVRFSEAKSLDEMLEGRLRAFCLRSWKVFMTVISGSATWDGIKYILGIK